MVSPKAADSLDHWDMRTGRNFLAFALWFVTVTMALVLWMLRIYGA